jgi:hypothetical protein
MSNNDKPETIFERMEVTVAELLIWIAAWEVVSLIMSDYSKRTKIVVYVIILLVALFVILPVYRKRLRVENTIVVSEPKA